MIGMRNQGGYSTKSFRLSWVFQVMEKVYSIDVNHYKDILACSEFIMNEIYPYQGRRNRGIPHQVSNGTKIFWDKLQ